MPGFAGFDRSDYPGDSVMNWLKANTISFGVGIILPRLRVMGVPLG